MIDGMLCSGICPAGTWSALYATECMPCDVGKYAPFEGSETCVPCPEHRTSEAGAAASTPQAHLVLSRQASQYSKSFLHGESR